VVSPELIRRFPFFSGLTNDQILKFAKASEEVGVDRDHYFHREGEELDHLFVLLEGEVLVVTTLPQRDREIVLNTLGAGDVFGWSALVPPNMATASAKSVTPCKLIAIDSKEIYRQFDEDPQFGYVMMQKVAQLIRDRLNAIRIETLAYLAV
jgi:CRP/FNR family transcriptional regulator, cyclic AMP receptor protein